MVPANILELKPSTGKWQSRQARLESPLDGTSQLSSYIFLDESAYPKQVAERRELLLHFNIPPIITTDMCDRCNGYFGSKRVYDHDGQVQSYTIWYRCLIKIPRHTPHDTLEYTWHEMTFVTRWTPSHCTVVCINTPDTFLAGLEQALLMGSGKLDLSDPYALHIPLMDQIIMLYDESVWGIRDLIRRVEKNRVRDQGADADFGRLHEISRHATHSTETLTVTIQTIESMLKRHKDFYDGSRPQTSVTRTDWRATHQYMDFQAQLIRNLKLRSQANQERLQSEITLAYNMITQRDSKVMVDIGKATQSDSTAMKTVAVVTMVFLPATFTSAIFSMSFFNYSPGNDSQSDEWRVSGKIWIYWVVAVPLTALTLCAWLLWRFKKEPSLYIDKLWSLPMKRQRIDQDEKA